MQPHKAFYMPHATSKGERINEIAWAARGSDEGSECMKNESRRVQLEVLLKLWYENQYTFMFTYFFMCAHIFREFKSAEYDYGRIFQIQIGSSTKAATQNHTQNQFDSNL